MLLPPFSSVANAPSPILQPPPLKASPTAPPLLHQKRHNIQHMMKMISLVILLEPITLQPQMQVIARAIKACQERFRIPVVQQLHKLTENAATSESPLMHQKGMENITVAEVLMTKEDGKVGSWLWCKSNDTVYDAVKQMARNNIGSLVVLKPGDEHMIAGIVTERDYLQKVIVKDRSSKYTRVGEIMTEQSKLVTVTSDTNIYQAMRLMSEHQIRHVPVIDGRIVGMISIVDVVRAVVDQQSNEVNKLNEFIKGDYF